ncbi:hypothetical protein [Pseudomonas sp. AA-38]|uniref:hypothetical protein n=1 Tax=Pseudomonas sp. AA-38 TaxID=3028807 RepID=UPI0023F86015|nr:hypothetical protein [Pseudomonas sp. AA-38]
MWLRIGLLLGCLFSSSLTQAADLDDSIGDANALLDELRRLIADKPAKLRVRLPNSTKWESLESLGLAPACRAPVLVRPSAPPRALTQCGGMQMTKQGPVWITASIFWTHDHAWELGQVLRLQVTSLTRQSNHTDDADLSKEPPMIQALAAAESPELEKLADLWGTLQQQRLPARPDDQWGAPEPWPKDLLALHEDGRVKLSGLHLAGLHTWQSWWADQPRTEGISALVGVEILLGGKSPALQLGELSLAQTPFAMVLLPADQQPSEELPLWQDENWQLLMVRTDGK